MFPFKKLHLKMPSATWRLFCFVLNVWSEIDDILPRLWGNRQKIRNNIKTQNILWLIPNPYRIRIYADGSACIPLQWRHNEHDCVSNHQPHHCLLSRPFIRAQIKGNIKAPRHWLLCGEFTGPSPGTGEFPAQMASNAENVSIWWRHHAS